MKRIMKRIMKRLLLIIMNRDNLILAVTFLMAAATFTASWNEIERKSSQAPIALLEEG